MSKYPIVNCVECKQESEAHYCEETKQRMVDLSLCFNCLFWTEKLDIKNDMDVVRIAGNHYTIAPDEPKGYRGFTGFGGRRFEIKFSDGRQAVTHNLWHQGHIPQHFKKRLPDNAEFVGSGRITERM